MNAFLSPSASGCKASSIDHQSNVQRAKIPAISCGILLFLSAGYGTAEDSALDGKVQIDARSFRCITEMTHVRHFYVDNLLGHLDATLAVANSATGGTYPAGSVIQLVPGEAMVKRDKGFNSVTHDWEFFELDVSKDGTQIRKRGFAEVVNRFGETALAATFKPVHSGISCAKRTTAALPFRLRAP